MRSPAKTRRLLVASEKGGGCLEFIQKGWTALHGKDRWAITSTHGAAGALGPQRPPAA